MTDIDETLITIKSTTDEREMYTVKTKEEFKQIADDIAKEMIRLLEIYTGNKITWIFFAPDKLMEMRVMMMRDYHNQEIYGITPKEWNNTLQMKLFIDRLSILQTVVFMGYDERDPIKKWIDCKIIQKHHHLIAMAKDPVLKEFYRLNSIYIEAWANSELDIGLKFPNCNKFHRLKTGLILDTSNEFSNSKDDCVCGIKGNTFTVYRSLGKL